MVGKEHLLTSVQMANFVADGLLVFPELIPDAINREAMREIDERLISASNIRAGQPLGELWPDSTGYGTIILLHRRRSPRS